MLELVLACACALSLAQPAAPQPADITGRWDLSMTTPQGTSPTTLVLKKDGEKIVGTLSAPQGDLPVEASVKDKAVNIWFTVPTQNGPINIAMTGTIDADAMKGSVDFGGRGQGEWSAKRGAAPAPDATSDAKPDGRIDVTGTWTLDVTTAAGSGTPTVVLKQTGEALAGHYSGQLGETDVTGTLKGNAIEFALDVSVQGTALHIVYSGTADAAAMKGTVRLGDFGDGTFTGKKTK
jgi:hypothetical protein